MNKFKLACLSSIFSTGIAYANLPCDGFEIKIKNNLVNDLVATKLKLHGGKILPSGIEKLPAKTLEVFTVNNTLPNEDMAAKLKFYTLSIPSKSIKIEFYLQNMETTCQYTAKLIESDYSVTPNFSANGITYTIE